MIHADDLTAGNQPIGCQLLKTPTGNPDLT